VSAHRPGCVAVVSGTGTDVGKTYVTALAARELRERGVRVAARKPVQSYAPGDALTDADVLAGATGVDPGEVCAVARWYARAMAPPVAAELLASPPFTITELVAELQWPPDVAIGLVEGVGGPRSPLAADGDTVDLADALHADLVVLVADSGLGAINAVLLATAAFSGRPVVVVLNRFDPADDVHTSNRDWLAHRSGLDVVVGAGALADRLARLASAASER
jgi:dethiobiotin synthetase